MLVKVQPLKKKHMQNVIDIYDVKFDSLVSLEKFVKVFVVKKGFLYVVG